MAQVKLLIFPLDLDDADLFIRVASTLNIEIVGASSAMSGPGKKRVDHFVRLPFVTDTEFDAALEQAIKEHSITSIYAPHQGVWRHLDTLLRTSPNNFSFALCRPENHLADLPPPRAVELK